MANQNQVFDDYVAKLPRTGHDIGRVFKFTSSTGMLLPVWQHVLNPSERINFRAELETITQHLVRPAFCDVQTKIDLFFVPMQMLYTGFGQVFYQTNDFLSSGVGYELYSPHDQFLPLSWFSNLNKPYWIDDFETARTVYGQPQPNVLPRTFFDSKYKGMYRLFMHLGYNPNVIFKNFQIDENSSTHNDFAQSCVQVPTVPWLLAAYQCIYQNYYRDDEREKRNLLSYQLDYMLGGGHNDSVGYLQYHQRRRDYFTSVHVSPIMSTLNQFASDSSQLLAKVNNYLDNSNIYSTNSVSDSPSTNQDFTQYLGMQKEADMLTTGMIRSLFAVEKLNRITGRARKNYDSQVLAHFGFKVPRDIKHEITFIGSIEGKIGIQQVISNSAAPSDPDTGFEGNELGERAGLGYGGAKGRALNFEAPCHGIVMAIMYSIPNQSYPLIGKSDKMNILNSRLDFFQPEFDRLGMQPMFGYEVMNASPYSSEPTESQSGWMYNLMLGWQYRYAQFKRKYDAHSVAFLRPYNSLREDANLWSPWVLGRNPFDIIDSDSQGFDGRTYQAPAFSAFYSAPTDLDDIFVQKYNTGVPFSYIAGAHTQDDIHKLVYRPWLLFQTDPFLHSLKVDCKLVSPMSVTGEPEIE